MQLRQYQRNALNALIRYFSHNTGNPCLEAPTSAGKSLIQASFIQGVVEAFPDTRVLCLTHQKELIEQNYLELKGLWPEADAGVYSAGLGRRNTSNTIIFAGIQSVHARAEELDHFDFVIIDEAHLVPVKTSEGMYRKFLDACHDINPNIKIIGMSATPYRLDNGMLTDGDNRIFTEIIPAASCGMSILDLLELGYLTPITTAPVSAHYSTKGVKKSGGDFTNKALNDAIEAQDHITKAACEQVVELGVDRKSWLIFATSIAHAEEIGLHMTGYFVDCAVITGDTPKDQRTDLINSFKARQLRCLINVNVLTTGFNARDIDLIAFMRPTLSANLYVQMCGRGMRLPSDQAVADGTAKADCLALDFAGLINTHGPINEVKPPKKKKKKDEAPPEKQCPDCFFNVPLSARTCEMCGFEFPYDPQSSLDAVASTADIIDYKKKKNPYTKVFVSDMTLNLHQKEGSPDMIRIDYYSGFDRVASEFICPFHSDHFSRKRFDQWISESGITLHCATTVTGIISEANRTRETPTELLLKKNGKYFDIKKRIYSTNEEAVNS